MNAAAQRRLTSPLIAAVAVLGGMLLSLGFGAGRGVNWDPPRPVSPLPAPRVVTLPMPPPLQSYAQTWEHPLFSADRKPIVTQSDREGVSLGDLKLTGIILTPTLHMALLGPVNTQGGEGKQVNVREGSQLHDSGWKLMQVLPRSAIFASPSGRTELKLPAGAPLDKRLPAKPGNYPSQGGPAREATSPSSSEDEEAQRLQKLRAAILKQRSPRPTGNQEEH